jgi:ParB family chromosome partitioning protein|tara:strand:- start:211 stop:1110 length:900 start_codon:yes stop_codon:yes gene_type:complete
LAAKTKLSWIELNMNKPSSLQVPSLETLLQVSPEQIVPNPQQPRKHFDQKSLNELAQSISSQGIIQPLVVRRHPEFPNKFELVAGERRWRALKQIDVTQVPVVLRNVSDNEILEVSILENIQRENLTVIEEAQSYFDLLQVHGYTQEELAKKLGRDRSTIANMLRLLQLPSALKNDLETGRITAGHARSILSLPNEGLQLEIRKSLLRNSWSVRETERQVRIKLDYLSKFSLRDGTKNSDSNAYSSDEEIQLQHLEDQLRLRLGTNVGIKFKNGKGQIKIDYNSLDEFERLYEMLVPKF